MPLHSRDKVSEPSNGILRLFVASIELSNLATQFINLVVLEINLLLHLLFVFCLCFCDFVTQLAQTLEILDGGLELFDLLAHVHVAICQLLEHLLCIRSCIELLSEILDGVFGVFELLAGGCIQLWSMLVPNHELD